MDFLFLQQIDGLIPVESLENAVAVLAQIDFDCIHDFFVIIAHKYIRHISSTPFPWNAPLPLECTSSIGMHFFHLIILLLRPVFYCYAKRKLSKRINRNKQIAYSLRTAIAV